MSEELRNRLKAARQKLQLTQVQASKEWKIPLPTLVAWENNLRTPTGFTRDALDAMLNKIMGGE